MSTAERRPVRFTSAYLQMLPMLIHKDVGQIPYHLARERGWDCRLVHWEREPVEVIEPADFGRFVTRVSLGVFRSRFSRTAAFTRYLIREARQTDVLLLYHLTSEALLHAATYKRLNPRGLVVLKLDMDHRGLRAFEPGATLKQRALLQLFSLAPLDLVTVETETLAARLRPHLERLGHAVTCVPIGIECGPDLDLEAVFSAKEDVVLAAGRLGLEQKHNELLLDALEALDPGRLGNWRFWFVGTRTPTFQSALDALLARRPDLVSRLVVRDFVASREELTGLYRRARVYCLTSRWESFAIVLAEAASQGCYLVSTDVGVARELTDQGRDGTLLPIDDRLALSATLAELIEGRRPTREAACRARERARSRYAWPKVTADFAGLVEARLPPR